jgi:hypothetical protein
MGQLMLLFVLRDLEHLQYKNLTKKKHKTVLKNLKALHDIKEI